MKDHDTEPVTEFAEGLPPAAPVHDDRADLTESSVRLNEPSAMEIFFAWEKLRLLHNGVFFLALFLRNGTLLSPAFTLYEFILIAATVNACYSTGPIVESYLTWFGVPRALARWSVFGIGTFVVVLFAFGVIWLPAPGPGERMRDWDMDL